MTTMTTIVLDDFLTRALLAGVGVALAAGPLGALIVWRRMAYFGDATAHGAILGVAAALALSLPLQAGTVVAALAMAVAVSWLATRGWALDTALGVLAHSALACGLVAISFVPGARSDLSALLFGDILAVSRGDLAFVWAGSLAVLALLAWRWSAMLTATLSPDLAQASGVNPGREQLALNLALAVTVAVALKIVGSLLIAALLIIPAAAARGLARSPEAMAGIAAAIGALAVGGGLWLSLLLDTPAGPSVVVVAAGGFVVSALFGRALR